MLTRENIEAEIQKVLVQLIEKYHPEKVILFGSAADPAAAGIGDLDFLVIKEDVPERGIDRILEVETLIERHVAADILVYRPGEVAERLRLGDPLVTKILSEGRTVYG